MPEMSGVEFLSRAATEWPDCVRVLLTGEADTRNAAAAVNQGQIFRFLTKPCPVFTLERVLTDAVKHHELITSERVLLERTLRGSMEVLTEILNLLHPVAFSRSNRIRRVMQQILPSIQVTNKWEFELAAMLSHIGCVAVPFEILDKVCTGKDLSESEHAVYWSHPETGRRLLGKIPRLELVAQIISSQAQPIPPIPPWHELEKADRLCLGSHLLKVAMEVEACLQRNYSKQALLLELRSNQHHPALLKAVDEMGLDESVLKTLPASDLACGMVIEEDVVGENGVLLIAKGQCLSETTIHCLQRRFEYSGTEQIVQVRITPYQPLLAGR
jgi:CheY-like chemotaxis protein